MPVSKLKVIVCAILLLPSAGSGQSLGGDSDRAKSSAPTTATEVNPTTATRRVDTPDSLESLVPREGLVIYMRMEGSVLQEMLTAGALTPFARKLLADRSGTPDRIAALGRSLAQAPDARLAVAVYRAGAFAFIETANEPQAEYLRTELDKARGKEVSVTKRGRVVIARTTEKEASMQDTVSEGLSSDPEFVKAQEHFAGLPLVGFLQLGSGLNSLPQDASASYAAGYLAGVANMPSAVAFGGSREGDTFLIRAMRLDSVATGSASRSDFPASISSLFSGVLLAGSEPVGVTPAVDFVPADSDVFLDVMIDWYKLYDGLSALLDKFAASMSGQGNGTTSVDLLPTLETKLGFSIRNDLLPTLGNELAISISGFDRLPGPKTPNTQSSASANAPPRTNPSPRFMLVLALKDPAGFEKLLKRLLAAPTGNSPQLPRTVYRGASIVHSKSVAYTIVDGFLIVSGGTADIRKALDARAAGTSLAAQARYRQVIPDSTPGMLRAYIGSSLASRLLEALNKEGAPRSELRSTPGASVRSAGPIGLVVRSEGEDTVMELRMPFSLVSSIVAAVSNLQPNQLWGDVGIPNGSGSRTGDGKRRSPTLTNEDLRRRP